MKRGQAVAVFVVCAVLAFTGGWYFEQHYEEEKDELAVSQRQLIYESILHSYSSALTNGMTREQVEDYLRKRGVGFGKICCLAQGETSADITKIGYERGPWYCNGYEVYVGFEFTGPLASEDPAANLKKVSIVSLPDDCL
jgi:hypothetical protein